MINTLEDTELFFTTQSRERMAQKRKQTACNKLGQKQDVMSSKLSGVTPVSYRR